MMKTVKINADWKGAMQVDVAARGHTIVIDQPESMGGKDAGANPLEIFLAALGGCMGTIAAIVAKQERIELRGFSIEIEGDIDVDFLMGKTKEGRAGFTEIRAIAKIDADLSDEEKKEFFEIVDSRCPISDNMIYQTKLVFEVK